MRMRLLLLLLAVCSLSACANLRDYRDAPWDPKPSSGRTLLDQIPNWDSAAQKRCGGHLRDSERGTRSAWC